ncbi:MAG: ammonium transporter, partial [Actinomycetia bacterium]|nr:ammonium transporter [Actinomycetes bacterium]
MFCTFLGLFPNAAISAEPSNEMVAIDTVWTMVAAFLVFFMQAGFSFLEAGLTRAKNVGNIMMKNALDFGIASISYWAIGFAIMFGTGNALFGMSGWFVNVSASQADKVFSSLAWSNVPIMAKLLFQLVFAGVAATIVSGAMAERTKFHAYLIYSVVITGVIYPIVGHWIWGGGWLSALGFQDFAGSTVVHGVGAWAALAGVLIIGPRLGKYGKARGDVRAIPGHSMPMVMLGVFILWFGWFGFNAGSTMSVSDLSFAEIALVTNLAGAAAMLTGMIASWFRSRKPDVTLTA